MDIYTSQQEQDYDTNNGGIDVMVERDNHNKFEELIERVLFLKPGLHDILNTIKLIKIVTQLRIHYL
jgi:hypothetical protein